MPNMGYQYATPTNICQYNPIRRIFSSNDMLPDDSFYIPKQIFRYIHFFEESIAGSPENSCPVGFESGGTALDYAGMRIAHFSTG
jgi:hypothetical protein